MKLRQSLGIVVREFRQEKGWTLRTLAKHSQVSLGYLCEVENGVKEVSSEVLQSIADGLGVAVAELVVEAGFRLGGYDYDRLFEEVLEKDLVRH